MHARSGRFPLIDSLRAIAALTVLFAHAAFYTDLMGQAPDLRPYIARLDVAVPVFFVVSGFLLYRPFVAARVRGEPQPRTGAYAWRRFLRIVPAYWVALTLMTIWLGLPGVFTLEGIPTYYGFAQIYSDPETARGGIFQAWTLCVEVAFYAFLPVWALFLRRLPGRDPRSAIRTEAWALAGLIFVSLAYKAVILGTAADPEHANANLALLYLPAFLDQLGIGMGMAIASVAIATREPGTGERSRAGAVFDRFPGIAWALAFLFFWIACTRIGLDGFGGLTEPTTAAQALVRHVLYALVALALVFPAAFGDQTRGFLRTRVLANPALLYVGVVSYGLYLWHTGVLIQLERWEFSRQSTVLWFAIGLAGGVALASLSWWLLERPVLRLKRLVPAGRPREQPGEPGPESPTGGAPPEPGPLTAARGAGS